MSLSQDVIQIVIDVLMLNDSADQFDENTGLLGSIPEFDSVAVVSLITELENEFGCTFDDDELNADVFASIGSLTAVLEQKIS
jgi:acyl carrier protein